MDDLFGFNIRCNKKLREQKVAINIGIKYHFGQLSIHTKINKWY